MNWKEFLTDKKKQKELIVTLQCYGLVVLFRMIAMYLLPLEAPAKLLPLSDPFVQLLETGEITSVRLKL